MTDADFFRRQAERSLRLSRTSYDMETSRQLRQMAAEFLEKADEAEAQGEYIPGAHRTNGAEGGDMDRD
jgi:hypothetical protein